jgi:hypothetical protein
MHPPPSPSSQVGRWAAAVCAVVATVLAVVVWGGFEVHDEVVVRPAARAVRLVSIPSAPANVGIEYVEGYDAGVRRATADDRPLLVIFRAGWCRWSAELTQGPLSDRRLIALSRRFVCVIIDADRHAADCRRCGVKEFPTVILASSTGVEQRRWTGCPSADDLVAALSSRLSAERVATGDAGDAAATR